MSLEDTLTLLNPWWEGLRSPYVEEWENKRLKWVPGWLKAISLKPFSLNLVMGPRLVGKTTGLHLLIEKELNHRDPLSVLYLNLDLAPSFEAFKSLLDAYLRMRRDKGIKSSLIVLDEVTSVQGWWKLVKGYVDAGVFRRDVLVLTGSSSMRLKGEVELFPGRMGEGKEVIALPLSFREFLSVKGVIVTERSEDALLPKAPRIRGLFKEYLKVGGFPLSINGDPRAEEHMIRSITGEVLRAGRSLDIARGVISRVLATAPSPASFNSMASDLSLSHRTVREYVELLEALMVLGQALYFEKSPKFRKERKIFVRDPFIARSLSIWATTDFLESAMYEWVVQEHVYRKYGEVYYWRNSYEIDVIANGLKVEVKAGKPHRRYPKGVRVLGEGEVPLFLAVL